MEKTFDERIKRLRVDVAASNDYDEQLDIWANTAANICHEIATSKDESIQVDRFFYAFQSPPKEKPEFLIVAFNPGDGDETRYEEGCKNPSRKYPCISGKELKEPNKFWDNHHTWRIWQNLMKSFVSTELNGLLNSFVSMNLVYFVSKKVKTFQKLKGAEAAQRICTELTNILVFDIFKPDFILCLGIESFEGVGNGLKQSQVLDSPNNKNVKSKDVNQTLVIGIPHASGARDVTDEERVNIGETIHQLIFKNPVTSINRVNTLKTKFDKAFLNELIGLVRSSESLSKLNITEGKETGGNIRYEVEGFNNDKLEITVSSQSFIGVRYAKIDGKYPANLEINRHSKALENLGFRDGDKGGNWLGIKSFGQYNTKDITDIIRNIEVDITKFLMH